MTDPSPDTILRRVAKLLKLANDSGATEAEAALAAQKVQDLLQEHSLTLAQVGTADGDTAARVRETTDRGAFGPHQVTVMAVLADNNFCLHRVVDVFAPNDHKRAPMVFVRGEWRKGWNTKRHMLVGRDINVRATVTVYDYLMEAMDRCAADAGFGGRSRERNRYLEGAATRIAERLRERRMQREAESAANQPQPKTNGTGRELVLSDVYGSEADLNNDALNSFPPGTTAARRREADAKAALQQAEHDRLVAEGVDSTVAWYRAYGYGDEDAIRAAASWKRRSRRRGGRGRSQTWTRADEQHHRKINSAAYRAGRAAGGAISLDDQVAATSRRALPGSN